MKQIWHLVLTGGPCSGKTTGIATIEKELSERGYYVLIVPETATELIGNGIRPFGNCLDNFTFQKVLFEKQLHKEKLYLEVAKKIENEKVVIVYDRGLNDNKSYLSQGEFDNLLKAFDTDEISVKDRYDAVFHLVTAANGAEEYYTLENNASRTETPEQARQLDKKGIENWNGHPHLRIIDNSTDFKQKLNRLMAEIYSVLGEPVPVEIERKYLIVMPDLNVLSKYVSTTVVNIVQTYLKSEPGKEVRVRQRGINGSYFYYLTEKIEISSVKRIEKERKISQRQYIESLNLADTSLKQIVKKRVCFVYDNQYFELDLFDFSKDKAIVEIELTRESAHINFPSFLNVIKEVTDDLSYRNIALAKSQKL
ncbi:MAG: AAA family ATPase [Clostridia bacterium]|nr:AAA family ATPase [Clostridia bacterium]